jgi:rubrerythrin
MDDYISREAAKLASVEAAQSRENGFQWGETVTFTTSKIIGLINSIPAADVRPVVRGGWKPNPRNPYWLACTVCGYVKSEKMVYNYCPNCGADMREAGQNER